MAKVIMIQGTMSNAGKSLVTAGLLRVFHQDGYRVAPFKSQNMALNSYITKDGKEMGRAQVMQAQAAGIEPEVCMNPILLKPTTDVGSQVIVNGRSIGNMKARDYFAYKTKLIPDIMAAYKKLDEAYDIIVIEGAGSPAEINLKSQDIVNMGMAKLVDAPVLLVGDIDLGGVFAQLYGTVALLEAEEQKRIRGFVMNKFRGDPTILEPGITMLTDKTGIPTLGVLPYMQLDLPEEDSLSNRFLSRRKEALLSIAVVKLPRISNFTDFDRLQGCEKVDCYYAVKPEELQGADCVILPGTKSTISDYRWLVETGMAEQIQKVHRRGIPIIGICGGFQMLGKTVKDPYAVETEGKVSQETFGFLPMDTVLEQEKICAQTSMKLPKLEGVFSVFSGLSVTGYEIHMGHSGGICAGAENVFGTYLHGIFQNEEVVLRLLRLLSKQKGLAEHYLQDLKLDYQRDEEREYDKLAAGIRENMNMEEIYRILNKA